MLFPEQEWYRRGFAPLSLRNKGQRRFSFSAFPVIPCRAALESRCDCPQQSMDFDSLRGAPPHRPGLIIAWFKQRDRLKSCCHCEAVRPWQSVTPAMLCIARPRRGRKENGLPRRFAPRNDRGSRYPQATNPQSRSSMPGNNLVISQLEVTSKWTIKSQSSPRRPTSP